MLIVIALTAILAIVMLLNLVRYKGGKSLDSTAKEMVALLREAQSRSVSNNVQAAWGVHFDNVSSSRPFFALFSGSYSTSTALGLYTLPAGVVFATSSIPAGTSLDVTFAQLTGTASVSSTIVLFGGIGGYRSSTITISSLGQIR